MLANLIKITENNATNSNPSISKIKNYLRKSYSFSHNLHKIYNILKEKIKPRTISVLEIIHSKKRANFNAYEVLFQDILPQPMRWRIPNTAPVCQNELLLNVFIIAT